MPGHAHVPLMSVPNFSEGRDEKTIADIATALTSAPAVRLLDTHTDADHHRTVYSLAGSPGLLGSSVLAGARIAVDRIDVTAEQPAGATARQHPFVGALDIAPIVYVREELRGAACAEALVLAERIGDELQIPVYLYGELTADAQRPPRTRAELRRGGLAGLRLRMLEDRPDFGPAQAHVSAGVTLVAARPPLVAFNLQLAAPATLADARRIAAEVRQHGDGGLRGLPGVRAIGVELRDPAFAQAGEPVSQVSTNVERPFDVSLADLARAVAAYAPLASAELVGLAPAAALEGFPADLPMPGFDPERHVLEKALGW
jgi:glutamate formiminotransferase/glutamate formiminotransferase/formiminotetrahydrofolate cyclodeaminase